MPEDTGWKCKNCGNFNAKTDICANCGKDRNFVPSESPPAETTIPKKSKADEHYDKGKSIPASTDYQSHQDVPIVCPSCGQSDQVQPASLARIAAPIKPSDTVVKIVKVWRWLFGSIFGLLVLVLVGGTLLAGCSVLLAGSLDETGFSSLLGGTMLVPLLCIGPIVLVIGGAMMLLIPWLAERYVKNQYQQKLSSWQRAVNKYSQLFYCARDAGVFIKGQNRVVPIEQMQSFLYEMQASEPMWPLGG